MLKEKQNILYISIFVLIMILLFTLGNCGPILDEPNCCGGVDIHTVWTNTSNKTIKYISFNWTPYNIVNDVVYGQFSDGSRMVTDPISSGQTYGQNRMWECMWYDNTILRATLDHIEIEYMDGSITIIDREDIDLVFKKQKR